MTLPYICGSRQVSTYFWYYTTYPAEYSCWVCKRRAKTKLFKNRRKCKLTWTFGRHLLWLFGRPEEHGLTWGAAPTHTNALNVHNILCVLIQIPQCTGACGGVHLLDEPQHVDILFLQQHQGKTTHSQLITGSTHKYADTCAKLVSSVKSSVQLLIAPYRPTDLRRIFPGFRLDQLIAW